MIRIEDVYKRYQKAGGKPGGWVLEGINLEIPKNVSVGLIGRNGAGKSTLLRLIAGNDEPTRGRIVRDVRVSFPLGLTGGLQGALSGRQNAKFVFRLFGRDADLPEMLEKVREFAGLGPMFDRPVNTFSHGMQARLRFAISLMLDFDVYLVDEVIAVGDADFRAKSRAAFRRIADHSGVIMVSHDVRTLKEFCKAGILLEDGKAHWFDSIDDALHNYRKNTRV